MRTILICAFVVSNCSNDSFTNQLEVNGDEHLKRLYRHYVHKSILNSLISPLSLARPNPGEIRVNEQLVLTCMHTLMAREHNRLAAGLAQVNPHWDDETLFQEARRINIGIIQHVTFNEFLPILLGKEVMDKFGLVLQKDGYWNG